MRIRIAGLIIILAAIFNSLAAATHEMLPHCTCRFSCLSARQIAWLIGWNSLNHWESDRDAAKVINVCCWWRTDDWRLHFVREREREAGRSARSSQRWPSWRFSRSHTYRSIAESVSAAGRLRRDRSFLPVFWNFSSADPGHKVIHPHCLTLGVPTNQLTRVKFCLSGRVASG
jgi:hypothetical protein